MLMEDTLCVCFLLCAMFVYEIRSCEYISAFFNFPSVEVGTDDDDSAPDNAISEALLRMLPTLSALDYTYTII